MGGPLDMTVPELLRHWAQYRADQPALIFRHPDLEDVRTVLTYEELYRLGSRCAAMLKHRGVGRETVVLVFLPNCPERAVIEAAALLLGAFTVTATCQKPDGSDLVLLARRVYARAIVLDPDVHGAVWEAVSSLCQLYDPLTGCVTSVRLPDLRAVVTVRRIWPPNEQDFLCYLRQVCSKEYHITPAPFPHHPCAVVQSAGGDGRSPKLAVHSHRNMVAFSKMFMPRTDSPRPMYFLSHPFGSVRGHLALSLCNPVTRILLDEWPGAPISLASTIYQTLTAECCPIAVLPPAIIPSLAAVFRDNPTNSFRLAFIGFMGQEASSEVLSLALQFSDMAVLSYVSAELLMAAVSIVSEPGSEGCGPPLQPGVLVSITDLAGNPLPYCNTPGQLLVRSPLLFRGYLHDPKATAASVTTDGYFRTGDLAQLVNDNLYIAAKAET